MINYYIYSFAISYGRSYCNKYTLSVIYGSIANKILHLKIKYILKKILTNIGFIKDFLIKFDIFPLNLMLGIKYKLFTLIIVRIHKGLSILDNISEQKYLYKKTQLNRLKDIKIILQDVNIICNIFYECFIFISRDIIYMFITLIVMGYYIN